MSSPPISPEQLAALPPELRSLVRTIVEYYERQIAELKAELAKGKKTPQNSSLPPSFQHPHSKPPRKRKKGKGKKRGGQPGHPKHERALIPAEQCQTVVPLTPSVCRRCGEDLVGTDANPLRHQVWELPEIKPLVTEYQRHRLTCSCCGETTCATLPVGVPLSQAGPRLVALTSLLMGCFRQSKRRVALFLEQVLGQPCSPGWVVKLQNQARAALRPCYDELVQQLPAQDQLCIDETPHKEGPIKAWLWDFVAQHFTVFVHQHSRAATVLGELLGAAYGGVTNCDRAKMYWSLGRLQWCWAHLKRDFQALSESEDGQVKRLGRDLLKPTAELFRHWARYRDGTITRAGWIRLMHPIRSEIDALLMRGAFSGNDRLLGMCWELVDHRDWLWTFLEVDGIEPTNNAGERALRHAVIWRKLSFGTQSAAGSRFVETLLTIVETCRQQRRNVFDFLTTALQAHFARQATPSLLPGA